MFSEICCVWQPTKDCAPAEGTGNNDRQTRRRRLLDQRVHTVATGLEMQLLVCRVVAIVWLNGRMPHRVQVSAISTMKLTSNGCDAVWIGAQVLLLLHEAIVRRVIRLEEGHAAVWCQLRLAAAEIDDQVSASDIQYGSSERTPVVTRTLFSVSVQHRLQYSWYR
jgi:hypothetical protein